MKQKFGLLMAIVLSLPVLIYAFWLSPYTVQVVPKVAAEPVPVPRNPLWRSAWPITVPKKGPKSSKNKVNYLNGLLPYSSSSSAWLPLTDGNISGATAGLNNTEYAIYDLGGAQSMAELVLHSANLDAGGCTFTFTASNASDMSGAVSLGTLVASGSTRVSKVTETATGYRYVKCVVTVPSGSPLLYEIEVNSVATKIPSTDKHEASGVIVRRRAGV